MNFKKKKNTNVLVTCFLPGCDYEKRNVGAFAHG
jgi:hypothetical protein